MRAVGLIGLGQMGHGIARNLLLRGRALAFLRHPGNRPEDEILALGGRAEATAAAVAASSDVVILCVTGAPQVEAVLTGAGGVLEGLRPGAVVVDCSTSLPEASLRMAARVRQAGGRFIDAPMTRTAQAAHEGRLNLLVGGDAEDLAAVRPVLGSFAERIEHVGPTGAGHRMKLLHNCVSVGFIALLAEAAAQAQDAGIAPARLVQILRDGGGAGVALDRIAPFLTAGDRDAMPFSIANAAKDLDYYLQMSAEAGAAAPAATGIGQALAGAVEAGFGEATLPELARILRRRPEAGGA